MSIQLIYGRAGTGKSSYCLNEIVKDTKKSYIIMPEQYSFNAEQNLLNTIGSNSVIHAEVLTFKRMAYRILTEVGGITSTTLSECGRSMLLYNILIENKQNLKFLGKSEGNVELVSTAITEFKKHNITTNMLENVCNNVDTYLKLKLQDINLIYKNLENCIKNRFIDETDILTILYEKLEHSKIFDNSIIYIDQFSGFTEQEYKIIGKLIQVAKKVNITACTDSLKSSNNPDTDIFYPNKQTVEKLLSIAKECKALIEKPVYLEEVKRYKNETLKHLEKNIYAYPYKTLENAQNIAVFLAMSPYSEIENIAKQIIKKVRDDGLRYRQIAIITKDINTYDSAITAVFTKYKIPFFIDEKKDLSTNILIRFILGAIEIFAKSWTYESVFSYLKVGLLDLTEREVQMLESYVCKWGIKGNIWYKEEWKFSTEMDLEEINNIRKKVVEPLLKFKKKFNNIRTVKEITENLYKFLIDLSIPEAIAKKREKLEQIGETEISNEYARVWNIVLEVFDEIVLVLGDTKTTFDKYKEIFKIGISNKDLGKIPATKDQVIIGDIDRSSFNKIEELFIIGLNDGVFPKAYKDEGFLNDKDRENLKTSRDFYCQGDNRKVI